jgi:flagellar biosynthesis protein FlhG
MQKTSGWLESFKSIDSDPNIGHFVQEKLERKAKTISITGGKGGVGKTSISIKFAKELAEQGNKVLLIDCDYNLSNTAIKLGIPLNDEFFSLISSQKDFEDCLYKDGNFHLLPSCNGSLDVFNNKFEMDQFIIDILYTHEKEYDYIFLDCPAGLQKDVLTLNAYCDHRVVVVTPDKSSITDSYSLIKILKTHFNVNSNHLIVNKVSSKKQFLNVVNTLSETIENFLGCRTSILGAIKRDEALTRGQDSSLFKGANTDIHKNFIKVLGNLTDKLNTGVNNYSPVNETVRNNEQEVQ